MKGKKIILAVTNDLTHDRRMYRICESLANAGASVTLVGRKQKSSKPYAPKTFNGIRISCLFNHGFIFYMEYNWRLFFFLLLNKFDVVCACDLDTAIAVRKAAWIKGKKAVYDAHEYFTEVPELQNRPIIKAFWKCVGWLTIPGFHAHYTVGEELASLMGEKYQVHFDIIRNIAPAKTTHIVSAKNDAVGKVLLYQGALNVGRGLEASIHSMVRLRDWQFNIAGEGDVTTQLKDLAIKLGIGERVHFLGWVHPDELPILMSQAKLGINLREAGSLNDYYSLPNKFFDAIHAGLPSINMNYPEYARICAKYPCALLLDEVNVDKIVEAIQFLDTHPDQYQSMSLECHKASKEYTWENESRRLISIYEKLVN